MNDLENSVIVKTKNNSFRAITRKTVVAIFAQTMADHNLTQAANRIIEDNSIYEMISFSIERSWGVDCRIYYRNDNSAWEWREELREKNPDIADRIEQNKPNVELVWSATGRDVRTSLAAIDLYQKMTAAAADFEGRLLEYKYLYQPKRESKND